MQKWLRPCTFWSAGPAAVWGVACVMSPCVFLTRHVSVMQVKNRESAARSRQRKQEYTADLEEQVNQLKEQNRLLLQRVIDACPPPEDKHSGRVNGEPLRRTRSGL